MGRRKGDGWLAGWLDRAVTCNYPSTQNVVGEKSKEKQCMYVVSKCKRLSDDGGRKLSSGSYSFFFP